MSNSINSVRTRTLTLEVDFFGVVGQQFVSKLTSDRNDRRAAFAGIVKLLSMSGVCKTKEVISVALGTNKVGQEVFIVTLTEGPTLIEGNA